VSKVERFEQLIAWQKARALTKRIYETTKCGAFLKDYGLANQMQRAAVSVMSNIAEGFERRTSAEFHQFLLVAKSSCAELRSTLYVSLNVSYLAQHDFDDVMQQAEEVSRILGGLSVSIARKRQLAQSKS